MPVTFTVDLSEYTSPEHLEDCIQKDHAIDLLREEVEALTRQVWTLKDEAAARGIFIADVMAQKRCPDCQRRRDEWY
jgi:hypothetical protein